MQIRIIKVRHIPAISAPISTMNVEVVHAIGSPHNMRDSWHSEPQFTHHVKLAWLRSKQPIPQRSQRIHRINLCICSDVNNRCGSEVSRFKRFNFSANISIINSCDLILIIRAFNVDFLFCTIFSQKIQPGHCLIVSISNSLHMVSSSSSI